MIVRPHESHGPLINRFVVIAITTVLLVLGAVFLGSGTLRARADIRSELVRRKSHNDLLAASNRALRDEVEALKDDPLVLEKAIRDELSLVDDGEVIILFDAPRVSLRAGIR